jgi:hypothetical protein
MRLHTKLFLILFVIGICFFFAPLKAHAYYGQGKTIILRNGVKILPNGNVVTPPPPTPAAVAAQRKYYQDLDKAQKEKFRKYNLLAAYIRSDWTADDAAYALLRKEIEKEYLGSPAPKSVYEKICAKYSRSSDHDFFARLLATELYGFDGHLGVKSLDELYTPYIQYACNRTDSSNPLPHSYNFQRAILIACKLDIRADFFRKNLGERYYQKEPDDFLTSYAYACELSDPQFSTLMEVLSKKYLGNPYLLELEAITYGCFAFPSKQSNPHPDFQKSLSYARMELEAAQQAYNNSVGWPTEIRNGFAFHVNFAKNDLSEVEKAIKYHRNELR